MRLKISCAIKGNGLFPYNYSYELQSAIYEIIHSSSPEFSSFLHNTGFITDNKPFKLFTFSKLMFSECDVTKEGFSRVKSFHLLFSTPIQKSYEHLVLGLFARQEFTLRFSESHHVDIQIISVDPTLPFFFITYCPTMSE